jgi:hypothetical protein
MKRSASGVLDQENRESVVCFYIQIYGFPSTISISFVKKPSQILPLRFDHPG